MPRYLTRGGKLEPVKDYDTEYGLNKSLITIKNKTEKTLAITTALVSLIAIVTALLPFPTLIPVILSAVTMTTALLTATKIAKQNKEIIEQQENDEGIIKYELSHKQQKYRGYLEN